MNRDIARGSVRHVKGRAETTLGGITGDLGRQAEGVVDQIAGGASYLYGKASDRAEDLIEAGTERFDDLRTGSRAGARSVARYARHHPTSTVAGIAALAFVLGWFLSPTSRRRPRRWESRAARTL